MKASVSVFLDMSRWAAAFLVVINHARSLILADYTGVQVKSMLGRLVYTATGLGHEAVVIFFVISGFLVGGCTLERWKREGPDLVGFSCARISRIYTVLVFALLIGLSLDYAGMHWLNASAIYSDARLRHIASMQYAVDTAVDLPTFLGNLLMMQGVAMSTLGSNVPLWSVAYEWWYYCLFALIAVAILDTGKWRIVYAGGALLIGILLPGKVVLWGVIWCFGLVAHRWIKSAWWRPPPVVGIAIFVLALLASRITHGMGGGDDLLLVSFARDSVLGVAYVVALASASRITTPARWPALHRRLADFSYTTYLFHFPALLLLVAGSYQVFGIDFPQQPGAASMAYLAACVVLVYGYCFAAWLLIERRTPDVRHKLEWVMRRGMLGLSARPDAKP